ncbi:MAG: HAD family hydrolase [Halobacteriales archaeon]
MSDAAYWFDLDGTLLEYAVPFERLLIDTLGTDPPAPVHGTFSREVFVALESFADAPFEAAFEALVEEHGLELDPTGSAAAFRERELAATRPIPGAEAALRRAGDLGAVGILTNGDGDLQRAKLRRHGLDALVDEVVVSNEVGARKPDPAIFEVAAGRLPAAVRVYIGDTYEEDVQPAADAGFLAVHVRHDDGPAVSLGQLAALAPLLGDAGEAS